MNTELFLSFIQETFLNQTKRRADLKKGYYLTLFKFLHTTLGRLRQRVGPPGVAPLRRQPLASAHVWPLPAEPAAVDRPRCGRL